MERTGIEPVTFVETSPAHAVFDVRSTGAGVDALHGMFTNLD